MRLHQLNQLSYPSSIENTWINTLEPGDSLLLIEEGILRCQSQQDELKTLTEQKSVSLYYLKSDALAYGISPTLGTALTDSQWVEITLNAESNISW